MKKLFLIIASFMMMLVGCGENSTSPVVSKGEYEFSYYDVTEKVLYGEGGQEIPESEWSLDFQNSFGYFIDYIDYNFSFNLTISDNNYLEIEHGGYKAGTPYKMKGDIITYQGWDEDNNKIEIKFARRIDENTLEFECCKFHRMQGDYGVSFHHGEEIDEYDELYEEYNLSDKNAIEKDEYIAVFFAKIYFKKTGE